MARPISTKKTPEERLAHMRAVNAMNARKWRKKNPLPAARNALRYWQKKVNELEAAAANDGQETNGD